MAWLRTGDSSVWDICKYISHVKSAPIILKQVKYNLWYKNDVKRRNTPGCLDQYMYKVLRLWNSQDRETV